MAPCGSIYTKSGDPPLANILASLPAVNAALNALSALAILTGIYRIRRGDRAGHMRAMWTATLLQGLFLLIYLVRILFAGTTVYRGTPLMRAIYLTILGSHMFLAMAVAPMVILAVWRGWKGQYEAHRRIARWTYPIWLYVTVTGPVVYLMLRNSY